MTKVDVFVPCYNYGRFLEACVESVLSQSVRDVRVLIIDDASSDNSVSVARKLAQADPRVSVVAHPRNKGHIATYNEGIAWASADYVLLLSADDLLVPGALQRATEVMDANPDIVLTYGECIVWHDDRQMPYVQPQQHYTWERRDLIGEMCAKAMNFVPTPTAIGRTVVQKEIGGYRASLPHSGDLEMWLRFAANGTIVHINAVQGIYRKHSAAMSNAYFAEMMSDYRQCQRAFDSFFDVYEDRLDKSRDLRNVARGALAQRVFQHGIDLLRRGGFNAGVRLIREAMDMDPDLRRCPPLWRMFKVPGPEGREWAKSVVKKGARQLLRHGDRTGRIQSGSEARSTGYDENQAQERTCTAKVDVIVPCYNYGHFLTACIESVLAQECVDVNVLVVDDASTDDSAAIAQAFADRDSRVRVISLPTNVGMIPAVNRGLREAMGDYFVKLDADDLLPPGSLKRSIALFERHPNVGFVYGRPRHFSDAAPRPRSGRPRWTIWNGSDWLALRCQQGVNCISQPEAVIRTRIFRQVGEYNAGLRHTSDLEMWLRLAAISDVGRINGVDQGYYRVHPNSMQRTVNAGLLTDLVGRREAFVSALAFARDRLRGTAHLEATVREKLASQALDRACRAFDRDRLDDAPLDALIEFAIATSATAKELPEWHALQLRKRRGRRSRWALTCLAPALLRRIREEMAHVYWLKTGV